MLIAKCDKKGRIYLKESVRSRYGEKFVIVEGPDGLMLRPVPEDPVKDLEELGRSLRKESLQTIKKRIRQRARKEVIS